MSKKMENVSSKYGAPMGRRDYGNTPENGIRLFRVYLDAGGYDNGGAYWGLGMPLYCAEKDDYQRFIRAASRKEAAEKLGIAHALKRKA